MKTFSLPARASGHLSLVLAAMFGLALAGCGVVAGAPPPESVGHGGGDY